MAAGGSALGVSESPPPIEVSPGGQAYPVIGHDLDVDGDEEVVLNRWSQPAQVVAADDRGILWRESLPEDTYLVGALSGDLTAGEGNDLLLVAFRYQAPRGVFIASADETGIRWSTTLPAVFGEINGFAQADADPFDEFVVTAWSEAYEPTLYTIDGQDGSTISELSSTPNELVGGFYSQVFVTDAVGTGADQAVFVTPLLPVNAGYLVERLSLADGGEIGTSVIGNAPFDELYQGPDLTGDGRRDALAFQYGPASIGVFDGASAGISWSHTFTRDEGMALVPVPYIIDDITGDGGSELCFIQYVWPEDDIEMHMDSATVSCHAGATGSELWREARTVVSEDQAVTHVYDESDLDGDGIIDPILEAFERRCGGGIEDYSCETTKYEALALSGVDGEPLWIVNDPAVEELVWGLTAWNIDGEPGDDGWEEPPGESPGAPFTVRSGLDLSPSWSGAIDTGDVPAYVGEVIVADVDGDGVEEAVSTATAYERIGEEICETYDGEEYCYYEYEEYAYVAAFEPGGEFLWQLEL